MLAGLAGIALFVVAVAPPDMQGFAARVSIVVVGVVAASIAIARSTPALAASPERFEAELRQAPPDPPEIAGLRAVENDLRMSAASAFGVEFRLKPVLRDLARWRLARDHATDMDADPEAARRILGEHLWQLVRPTEAFPEMRAPGVPLADLQAPITWLERT